MSGRTVARLALSDELVAYIPLQVGTMQMKGQMLQVDRERGKGALGLQLPPRI